MLRPILLLFCFISFQSLTIAQTKLVKGQVLDAKTSEALPFATISIPETLKGTVSNANGEFELKVSEKAKSILVSYIGYEDHLINLKKKQKSLKVKMNLASFDLEEVIVYAMSPLDYIEKAVKNYPSNVSTTPFETRGFFSEKSTAANDKTNAYQLTEAVFKSYLSLDQSDSTAQNQLALMRRDSAGTFRTMLMDNKRLKKMREKGEEPDSVDMDINIDGMTGGGPADVLDIAKSIVDLPFFENENFKKFIYSFGESTTYQGRKLIAIDFVSKRKIEFSLYDGRVYLDVDNLAIVALDYKQNIKIPFYINMLISGVAKFKLGPITFDFSIRNQVLDEKWYPKEMTKDVSLTLIQQKQEEVLRVRQIFNIDQITTSEILPIDKAFRFDPEADYEGQIHPVPGISWDDVNVVKQ